MKKSGKFYGEVYKYTLKATEKSTANGDAGKCYVGQTGNTKKRQDDWDSINPKYAGRKINRAREIYPPEDWERETLFSRFYMKESTRKLKLDSIETEMIIKFNAVNNGFNTSYGRGMKGLHHTPESKLKISRALKGVKKSPEHRKAMSEGKKKAKLRRERELRRQQKQQALSAAA